MSQFAKNLLPSVKLTLRETSVDFDQEIESYIDGCANNLQVAGILPYFFLDSLTADTVDSQILQAIRLYCLSLYGLYNSDSEKYDRSYRSIKATLCTNEKYTVGDPSSFIQKKAVVFNTVDGKQVILPDEGKVLSQVTVLKPETMIADNIRKDVDIAGVVGSLEERLPEEEKAITITENGTTEVVATEGKAMSKVAITSKVVYNAMLVNVISGKEDTLLTREYLTGLTVVRKYAFQYMKGLIGIQLPDSVTKIEAGAFNGSGIRQIQMPDSITMLEGGDQFSRCEKLQYVKFSENLTEIPSGAFSNCSVLNFVTIPNKVTTIGQNAFRACAALTSVEIPNSVTKIVDYAFAYCYKLANVTLPNSIKTIGTSAFHKVVNLTILATTPPTIQSGTFDAAVIQKIVVPKGTGDAYKAATNWSTFASKIEEAAE